MKSARTTMTFRVGMAFALAIAFSALLMIIAPAAHAQSADDGAEIYGQNCSSCHGSDGLGVEGVFPPLAGNPDAGDVDWVVEVVTNGLEGKVIMGVSYSAVMPPFGGRLSPQEIDDVSAYVVELSDSGGSTTPTTPPSTGEGSAAIGEDLFTGTIRLANGGLGCIACHKGGTYDGLGGPTLAFDLNEAIDTYGTAGFVAVVTDPVVEAMIAVFDDRPVTEQEAKDIAAYLEAADVDPDGGSAVDILVEASVVGFLALILITAMIVKGPQKSYVKKLKNIE